MPAERPRTAADLDSTAQHATAALDLDLLRLPRKGRIYDLASGWWPGMPVSDVHPPFQVLTYRTPRGQRAQGDIAMLADNSVNFHFISELVMCTMHSGTHIDALSHVTCGSEDRWYGGDSADERLGDFGPLRHDACDLGPMITRGIMLDVASALGLPHLEAHHAITVEELELAEEHGHVSRQLGDVVLIRTGTMGAWPVAEELNRRDGAGISADAAAWLLTRGPAAIGADNRGLEVAPSAIPGDPSPVHRILLHEAGIPILEWVNQESLAEDRVYEFLFICLPLTIRGATGSVVRPVAIA
jgi:kynurenine formamidase